MKRDRWNNKKKAAFLIQLGELLEKGYSLAYAIEFLMYYERASVQMRLREMLQKLKEGTSFCQVMNHVPKDIQAFIYFSERNGDLAYGLQEAGKVFLKREQVKERFQKLLRYPLFLLWLISVIFLIMNFMLFPQFVALFDSVDGEIPTITKLFLKGIDLIPFLLLLCFAITIFAALYYTKRFRWFAPHTKVAWLMKIPYLSSFLSVILTYYFVIQFSGLLKGGMSVHDALTVFEEQDNLLFYQEEGRQLKLGLQQGEKLESLIQKRNYYRPELASVISFGQHKGQLEMDLLYYSEMLFRTLEDRVKKVLMIIQPSLFGVIGLVVFLMFLSLLLPVFQLIHSLE